MNHFAVDVTREDGFWVAVVRGLRGGATESRRLSALKTEVTDLVGGLLDLDADEIDLAYDMEPALGVAAIKAIRGYEGAKSALTQAQSDYDSAQRDVVHELRATDVSLRDAAHLLGISFQRVQQLAD